MSKQTSVRLRRRKITASKIMYTLTLSKNSLKLSEINTSKCKVRKVKLDSKKHAYFIENFLTKDECERLIKYSEKLGYKELPKNYDRNHRNNKRVIMFDDDFAKKMYKKKIIPLFKKNKENMADLFEFRDSCYDEKYRLYELNNMFRFCKYDGSAKIKQFFKTHIFLVCEMENIKVGILKVF